MMDASTVADLLLASTDPGAQWASSGDNGVYVAVANQPGRSYKALVSALAVGPVADATGTRADASIKDNAVVSLSDNLVGSCTDDNGVAVSGDACIVPSVAIYATDPAGALNAGASLTDSVPDGFQPVSGVVTIKIGGVSSGSLPCSAVGCTASIRFPVMESANRSQLYQCFQVVNGQVLLSAAAVEGTASRAIDAVAGDVPTFTCKVKQAGTFMVGKYPDPSYTQEGIAETTYTNVTDLVSIWSSFLSFRCHLKCIVRSCRIACHVGLAEILQASIIRKSPLHNPWV